MCLVYVFGLRWTPYLIYEIDYSNGLQHKIVQYPGLHIKALSVLHVYFIHSNEGVDRCS